MTHLTTDKNGHTRLINTDKRLAGGRRWFEYHCYEGEDSSDAKLWHHTHQKVVVLKKIRSSEVMGSGEEIRMYQVRFTDGFEYDVFGDELLSSPTYFDRPDYTKSK